MKPGMIPLHQLFPALVRCNKALILPQEQDNLYSQQWWRKTKDTNIVAIVKIVDVITVAIAKLVFYVS